MPVSVAGASAASFAQRLAGARPHCPQRTAGVAADHNVRRRRGDDRDAQLIAARLRCGQRCRRPSRISSAITRLQGSGRPWPRGMKEQL